MSEVISFRLSKDNPREAQAMAVLQAWVNKGYSVRYVLTEALLVYDDSKKEMDIHGLSLKLDQISKMLQQNGAPTLLRENTVKLSDSFTASIRNAAKPGVNLG